MNVSKRIHLMILEAKKNNSPYVKLTIAELKEIHSHIKQLEAKPQEIVTEAAPVVTRPPKIREPRTIILDGGSSFK